MYIYAHEGGAVFSTAGDYHQLMSVITTNLNCVVISVDFRNGPEVKCPTGQQDCVSVIHHILDNSKKYGIDPKRACLAGLSGGGWIVTGAMNLLVKASKSHIIKALFIHSGMLSNEPGRLPDDQHEKYENRTGMPVAVINSIYQLHATDYDNQWEDD